MDISIPSSGPMRRTWIALAVSAAVSAAASPLAAGPASAAPCEFEPQGEGRVTAVLDARSFRLQDGREVRLAGIEAPASEKSVQQSQALGAMLIGRDVRLGATDDTPDRYGRQTAFAFLATSEIPVQAELLMQGEAVASASVADKECGGVDGRRGRRAGCKKRHLGRSDRHKKHRKSGRYFDGDWAIYAGRGQGIVRAAGRGDHLFEFRTELDTGLCCDYSKAGACRFRGGGPCA